MDLRRAAAPRLDRRCADHALHRASRAREPVGRLRRRAYGGAEPHSVVRAVARAASAHSQERLGVIVSRILGFVFALCVWSSEVRAQEHGAAALANAVALLGEDVPRVLYIAAHPDDEDVRLITWLSRSGKAEVAYLSLTRGDGGQNLLGDELGEALGVLRTQELLAARRIDGARQYFTRAYDFGYSKSAEETYTHWPRDSLLNDVVRVVRAFRPHVIVATFSGTPRDNHGQHVVSGQLARDAYELSGDVARFPVAEYGPAWRVSKLYRNASFYPDGPHVTMNVGEYNPLNGVTYDQVSNLSRSTH